MILAFRFKQFLAITVKLTGSLTPGTSSGLPVLIFVDYCIIYYSKLIAKIKVRPPILQTKKKLKVRYLRSLLFDLFEILQAVRT